MVIGMGGMEYNIVIIYFQRICKLCFLKKDSNRMRLRKTQDTENHIYSSGGSWVRKNGRK